MRPLRTREDLIAVAAPHAPTRACATAISQHRVTVLGGFTASGGLPCWIIEVRSKYGRTWYVQVACDERAGRYRVSTITAVPWSRWLGRSDGKRPLIDGDDPVRSAWLQLQARKDAAQTTAG